MRYVLVVLVRLNTSCIRLTDFMLFSFLLTCPQQLLGLGAPLSRDRHPCAAPASFAAPPRHRPSIPLGGHPRTRRQPRIARPGVSAAGPLDAAGTAAEVRAAVQPTNYARASWASRDGNGHVRSSLLMEPEHSHRGCFTPAAAAVLCLFACSHEMFA